MEKKVVDKIQYPFMIKKTSINCIQIEKTTT